MVTERAAKEICFDVSKEVLVRLPIMMLDGPHPSNAVVAATVRERCSPVCGGLGLRRLYSVKGLRLKFAHLCEHMRVVHQLKFLDEPEPISFVLL